MTERLVNQYVPEIVAAPGETLAEILEDRGMSQAELAERMGRPKKTISEIVGAKAEITPETALQLEHVLGVPASFWSNLERNYRDYLARAEEMESLLEHVDWPRRFPLRQMEAFGFTTWPAEKTARVRALLEYFGVSSLQQWESRYVGALAAFRLPKKFEPDIYALTAWLREGERVALAATCAPFQPATFRGMLQEARALTMESEPEVFLPRLRGLCAQAGIAVAVVPELKGARACGATRWLSPTKALIQLSFRYKSNDQFWFTFFHECGHIELHGKREAFVEVWRGSTGSKESENEANRFSADLLIPPQALRRFIEADDLTERAIVSFAKRIAVAAGIVVGRLQHDGALDFSQFNQLKIRYRWTDDDD